MFLNKELINKYILKKLELLVRNPNIYIYLSFLFSLSQKSQNL